MSENITYYRAGPFKTLAESKNGKDLWEFVNNKQCVIQLKTATALGSPAVSGIEEPLLKQFKEKVLEYRVKQMIGHMVRQVMEAEGYIIEKQNVKIAGALFSKGTRYCRSDWQRLHVFRNSNNVRKLCFAASRDTEFFPPPSEGGRWLFWASFLTPLQGRIAYGIDVKLIRTEVASNGFALWDLQRLLRAN